MNGSKTTNGSETPGNATLASQISDLVEAASPRILATQFLDLIRNPVVGALCDAAGIRGAQRTGVQKFLTGTAGSAMLRLGLGAAMPFIPVVPRRYRALLAEEYRISAVADIGNAVATVIMRPITKVAAGFFEAMGEAPEIGVAAQEE